MSAVPDITASSQDALFDGFFVPVDVDEPEALSADRRRTQRQHADVTAGHHPLTRGPLHEKASRDRSPDSRALAPFTCGTCVHRIDYLGYPKCDALGDRAIARSAATDVRAWWPACPSYDQTEDLT